MALWLAVSVLSLFTALLVAAPLFRRRARAAASRAQADLLVYRAQLAEVDRDVERGLLAEAEAEAARTEVKRRMLAAAGEPGEAAQAKPARAWRIAAALLGTAAPAVALGLYLSAGAPGQIDRPLAGRDASEAEAGAEGLSAEEAVEALARALESRPTDVDGWSLLGRSYVGMGRYAEAAEALGRAHRLAPDRVEIASAFGEAEVAAAEGVVGDEAKAVFEGVLAADPREPRARFYLGLAKAQGGDVRGALQDWVDLAALSPAEAPWLASVQEQIARAAGELGVEIASLEPSAAARALGAAAGPVAPRLAPGDADAIEQMSDEQREAMIRSMVERLASRLETNPDDRDGWLRLARAYEVLGEAEKAEQARARAEALER
ncbi:MAG: c-type cytochrome biogenesis protein CcmI [Rhodospirillales bacterium]|nr:c-type cytochrome biogenesis protein CcmI [Rhodospirillales bacterium]